MTFLHVTVIFETQPAKNYVFRKLSNRLDTYKILRRSLSPICLPGALGKPKTHQYLAIRTSNINGTTFRTPVDHSLSMIAGRLRRVFTVIHATNVASVLDLAGWAFSFFYYNQTFLYRCKIGSNRSRKKRAPAIP